MALNPSDKDELLRAREVIKAQLDELQLRMAPYGHGNGQPPDFRGVRGELEQELHEIDEILGADQSHDTD